MIFNLLIIYSFSKGQTHIESRKNSKNLQNNNSDQTYYFDKIGFYSLQSINNNDRINIMNLNQASRLFLFSNRPDANVEIKIDESTDINFIKADGITIDALDNVNFKFSLDTNQSGYNKISINLWILPKDLCPKSSFYGITGKDLDVKIHPFHSNSYSMCAFSPIFDLSNHDFKIQFGISSGNEHNGGFSSLYTDNFYQPAKSLSGYNHEQYFQQKTPYFIKYDILKHINSSSPTISELNNQNPTKIIFKRFANQNTKNNNSPCKVAAIHSCTLESCIDENANVGDIEYKCVSLSFIFFWTTSSSIGTIIAVVVLNVICISLYCCYRYGCICGNDEPLLLDQDNQQPLLTPNYTQDSYPLITTNDDEEQKENQTTNYEKDYYQPNQINNENPDNFINGKLAYVPQNASEK